MTRKCGCTCWEIHISQLYVSSFISRSKTFVNLILSFLLKLYIQWSSKVSVQLRHTNITILKSCSQGMTSQLMYDVAHIVVIWMRHSLITGKCIKSPLIRIYLVWNSKVWMIRQKNVVLKSATIWIYKWRKWWSNIAKKAISISVITCTLCIVPGLTNLTVAIWDDGQFLCCRLYLVGKGAHNGTYIKVS